MSIQLLVLRRCASASLSGLPANSGLKCDQFNCGIGAGWIGCAGRAIGYAGGTGGAGCTTVGTTGSGWGACGPLSAMSSYIVDHTTK